MNDSEWAKNLAKKYRSSLADQTRQEAALAERHRILVESTADLFSALRTAFDAQVKIINGEMGHEAVSFSYQSGSHSFSIKRNPPGKNKTIVIQCDNNAHTFTVSIHGKTPGDIRHLTVEVNAGSGAGYLAENGKSITPDEVAIATVTSLLMTE